MENRYTYKTESFLRVIIFLMISFWGVNQSAAQIIYVDLNATGTNDGTSWANAYDSLHKALDLATASDQVWVAKGTYRPAKIGRDSSFEIVNGLEVYGGFDGTENSLAARSYTASETILSGDLLEDDFRVGGGNTDNSKTVVYFKGVDNTTKIEGFTISGGNADDNANPFGRGPNGGGIVNDASAGEESSPVIENCIIKDNEALLFGGGFYNNGGFNATAKPTITNCIFENNLCDNDGGALYNQGASSTILGRGAFPIIEYCTFTSNEADVSGGAMFNNGSTGGQSNPYIFNCVFEFNNGDKDKLDAGIGSGGAIYNKGDAGQSNATIINSIFNRNQAYSGGAVYNLGGGGGGGGESSALIKNCTFYLNEANGASGFGGAIYNNADNEFGISDTEVVNSIFEGNEAQKLPSVFRNVWSSPTISYSLIVASTPSLPDCASLDDNGGSNSSLTCGPGMIYDGDANFVNPSAGDFHLANPSDAYNTGDNTCITNAGVTIDLDLNLRIQLGTVDMGPYESDQVLPVELVSFTAVLDNGQTELEWTTATELNNDYFTIERSLDGTTFEEIGIIPGHGTTANSHSYQLLDTNPYKGINYYRLKQTDYDGTTDYSQVVAVSIEMLGKVSVFPNPASNHINIALADFKEGEMQYEIYNSVGQKVHTGLTQVNSNISVISVSEINNFIPGNYTLRVFDGKQRDLTFRFTKVRL